MRKLLAIPLALTMAACADTATEPTAALGPDARLGGRGAVQPKKPGASPTIVDVAIALNGQTGEFSTLIAAVLAAGIADELSARGQRTVFAPTDAAFAELGLNAGNIGSVPVDALKKILLYHVAPGRRLASSVVESDRIRMASGGFTRISVTDAGAFINQAQIIATDVEASNGVIHVIDAVLLP